MGNTFVGDNGVKTMGRLADLRLDVIKDGIPMGYAINPYAVPEEEIPDEDVGQQIALYIRVLDQAMNQFFGINGMPTVPSTYWNDVHGYKGEDVLADVEGTETIRNMATNMAFMLKAIQAGKAQYGKPDVRHTQFMNFIR